MQLTFDITPGYIEAAVVVLLCAALLTLRLYRRFPVHLIYRSKIGFESMLDAIDEPLAVISKDYCVRRVNKAYLAMTGRSYKACINAKCHYLLRGRTSPCEDCRLEETWRIGAAREAANSPHPKDGHVNITFTPCEMPLKGGAAETCVIEHIRDITVLEKLRNDLERRNKFLTTLTERLRAARRSVKSELYIARQIQRGLLPPDIPKIDRMRIDLAYRPVSDVGGDLYDFIAFDESRFGLFIGDATGHGLASSLVGALSKMSLYNHSRAGADISPPQLLERMNRDLVANIKSSHYLTCVWCVFDFERNVVRYSKAGHPLQIVLRKNGGVEKITGAGVILGIADGAEFELNELPFEKGDRFFFFTDGIFDICKRGEDGKPGELLGFDNFFEMAASTRALPFEEILPTLKSKLSAFIHEDDYTLIVTEIT